MFLQIYYTNFIAAIWPKIWPRSSGVRNIISTLTRHMSWAGGGQMTVRWLYAAVVRRRRVDKAEGNRSKCSQQASSTFCIQIIHSFTNGNFSVILWEVERMTTTKESSQSLRSACGLLSFSEVVTRWPDNTLSSPDWKRLWEWPSLLTHINLPLSNVFFPYWFFLCRLLKPHIGKHHRSYLNMSWLPLLECLWIVPSRWITTVSCCVQGKTGKTISP